MNLYNIETTYGPIQVEGDEFVRNMDAITGELLGYDVLKSGKLIAFVAPQAFGCVTVKPGPEASNEITLSIDDRALLNAIRKAEQKAGRK